MHIDMTNGKRINVERFITRKTVSIRETQKPKGKTWPKPKEPIMCSQMCF